MDKIIHILTIDENDSRKRFIHQSLRICEIIRIYTYNFDSECIEQEVNNGRGRTLEPINGIVDFDLILLHSRNNKVLENNLKDLKDLPKVYYGGYGGYDDPNIPLGSNSILRIMDSDSCFSEQEVDELLMFVRNKKKIPSFFTPSDEGEIHKAKRKVFIYTFLQVPSNFNWFEENIPTEFEELEQTWLSFKEKIMKLDSFPNIDPIDPAYLLLLSDFVKTILN